MRIKEAIKSTAQEIVTRVQSREIFSSPLAVSLRERLDHGRKRYDCFMYEHGRTVADTLSAVRAVGGFVEAGLIFAGRKDIAQKISLPLTITDLDGRAARKHKVAPTKEDGAKDRIADRLRAASVDTALTMTNNLNVIHPVIRLATDVAVEKGLRPYFNKLGVDTPAGAAGKVAAVAVDLAEFSAESKKNPEWVQYTADALKVGRVVVYAAKWYAKSKKVQNKS